MDEKKFLERLTELAEWYRPQIGPNGRASPNTAKSLSNCELEDEYSEEPIVRGPNQTIGPKIRRLKNLPKNCEDCDQLLEQPRIIQKQQCSIPNSKKTYWRERCTICNRYRHPKTGEFKISIGASHQFFKNYYKIKNITDGQTEEIVSTEHGTQIYSIQQDEHSIIRSLQSDSKQ